MEWISVKDKMPNSFTTVILYKKGELPMVGYYANCDDRWVEFQWASEVEEVTHWMPLPEPPK